MAVDSAVVVLQGVTVRRPGGNAVLHDIDWAIREGETWAVVGPVGSGKTTLAETLLGRHPLAGGSVAWPLLDRLRAAGRRIDLAGRRGPVRGAPGRSRGCSCTPSTTTRSGSTSRTWRTT